MVGRQGGEQKLNLQPFAPDTGCFRLGTIVHEFTHGTQFLLMFSSFEAKFKYIQFLSQHWASSICKAHLNVMSM